MKSGERITLATLGRMKRERQPIVMLTAYDYPTAQIEQAAGVHSILVGDSAAQVILGHPSTLPITVDFLVTLAAAVRRGAPNVFLVGDMPYLSFNINSEEAIRNAGRFMAEAGCDCVKIECDARLARTVEAMASATIPVMVHLGLRPQAVHQFGGYRAQARTAEAARQLLADAKTLESAGAAALLLEAVPPEPARKVTEATNLPVIGCGAGPYCDGHVVVLHDMLGLSEGSLPRFVKRYADTRATIARAVEGYVRDITEKSYPAAEHCYEMSGEEAGRLDRGSTGS